ncbi:serine hydrolase [Brevibacillus sp. GCM10020057]|uniref:serine hydrolase n=1 Tax=Brevibacillus sp. GCM10020057 TaxID=3317327 RepID=UPI00366E97F2
MRTGIVLLLCFCLSSNALALDKQEVEKKPKPVLHPAATAWDRPGASHRELLVGQPSDAGMTEEPLEEIDGVIEEAIAQKLIPGAVVLVARRGVIVKEQAYGFAARYADDAFTRLRHPIRMQPDTMFDLASISKLFTATAIMQLADRGLVQLDAPVASYLPEFAANGKEKVTIRQLLTHTSGFQAYMPLYKKGGSRAERLQAVLCQPLVHPPGSTFAYSDLNMIALGALVERRTGQRLDSYVQANILTPMGMTRTMYNPPKQWEQQTAATEFQQSPERGLVWGSVQDENAWALGGAAGHAGLFGTARDLAVFGQMFLNGGTYKGKRILSAQSVASMAANQLAALPGEEHGLGWELGRGAYMDALGDGLAMGHTGFTGTALVVSKSQETIAVLLTNRIHPTRETESITPLRSRVFRQVALAIPVHKPWRDGAWFAGAGDERQATLTAQVMLPGGGTLTYDTWYRLENEYDFGYLEVSPDGKSWLSVASPVTGESDWAGAACRLPEGTRYIRFRCATDATINGRGWYVHHPAVYDAKGRPVQADWVAEGWHHETAREEEKQ